MKQQKVIFLLLVITVSLIIALSTGIGYATGFENSLRIEENQMTFPEYNDFRVGFTGNTSYEGNGKAELKTTGPVSGIMNVTGLNKRGDYVIGIFKIKNTSHDLYALLSESFTNSNPEYFDVTVTLTDYDLQPKRGEAELRIKVELIKTPINKPESSRICVYIDATPDFDR